MQIGRKLTAKEIALLTSFTALYTYFSFIPAFPIIGLPSKAITIAAIAAPIIGIILGPYLGMLSTLLGGALAFSAGHFSPPSFVAGIVTAVFAGTLYKNKRSISAFTYFSLLFFFGFYPFVGPVWLYPLFMWFQMAGFLVLISPLQSTASKNMRNPNNSSKLFSAFFTVFLTSTLAGQIAGSLTFELISWPIFMANIYAWTATWQTVAWLYPIERVIIALIATFVGVFLYRILIHANLMPFLNQSKHRENV
jgi:predicted membrane protein